MIYQKIYIFFSLLSVCNALDWWVNPKCDVKVPDVDPNNVFLYHCVGTEKFKYNLATAHIDIPNSPKFIKTLPIVIVSHGYLPGIFNLNQDIVVAIEKLKKANVLYLDYSKYAVTACYEQAIADAIKIGEHLGICLSLMKDYGVLGYHLIGHSLGAHLSGFAGKTYKKLRSSLIDRITGLDCAGPCFRNKGPNERLDFSDAVFVDCVHTDKELGLLEPIGHADYFPNGGDNMPGILNFDHIMSLKYFLESITKDEFVSVNCQDWDTFKSSACKNNPQISMGYWAPNSARGNYYLKTKASPLYSLGKAGIL